MVAKFFIHRVDEEDEQNKNSNNKHNNNNNNSLSLSYVKTELDIMNELSKKTTHILPVIEYFDFSTLLVDTAVLIMPYIETNPYMRGYPVSTCRALKQLLEVCIVIIPTSI